MSNEQQLNQELADAEVELAGAEMPALAEAVATARERLFGRSAPREMIPDETAGVVLTVGSGG